MRRCFAASGAVAGMICCLIASDGWGQTADPVFANSFEAGLIAFGTLFPVAFYRSSRGMWASFLYVTGSNTERD